MPEEIKKFIIPLVDVNKVQKDQLAFLGDSEYISIDWRQPGNTINELLTWTNALIKNKEEVENATAIIGIGALLAGALLIAFVASSE